MPGRAGHGCRCHMLRWHRLWCHPALPHSRPCARSVQGRDRGRPAPIPVPLTFSNSRRWNLSTCIAWIICKRVGAGVRWERGARGCDPKGVGGVVRAVVIPMDLNPSVTPERYESALSRVLGFYQIDSGWGVKQRLFLCSRRGRGGPNTRSHPPTARGRKGRREMNSLASSLQEDLGTLNIEIVHISKRINARNLQLPLLKQLFPSLWLPAASKPASRHARAGAFAPARPERGPRNPSGRREALPARPPPVPLGGRCPGLGAGGGRRAQGWGLTKLSNSGFEEKSGFSARTYEKKEKRRGLWLLPPALGIPSLQPPPDPHPRPLPSGTGWGPGPEGTRRPLPPPPRGAPGGAVPDLLGEDGDVLVEGVGGADVPAGHAGLPGRAGRQLALLKDQGEEGKQRVPTGQWHTKGGRGVEERGEEELWSTSNLETHGHARTRGHALQTPNIASGGAGQKPILK